MVYASTMENPQIAIIDLDVLNEPYKKTYAYDVLKWLKSNGQAQWARYKGVSYPKYSKQYHRTLPLIVR
jgi:O-acetylhomoserine/O-acetylserine sulfhydrylase-like pyridoxal-dependent enzyme